MRRHARQLLSPKPGYVGDRGEHGSAGAGDADGECASKPLAVVYVAPLMATRILSTLSCLFLFVACQTTPAVSSPAPGAPQAPSPATAKPEDKQKDEQKQKEEAKRQKQKDLRNKQRELDYAKVEQQTGELDRRVRGMTIEAALKKTASDLEQARTELDVFLKDVKPRELEEKHIALDQSTYRAEHSKDELGELTAMYEADEFARTTKELVLKRGRRELEMAERALAVARKEVAHFEQHAMPQRERALRQKVADAELERKKAELEADKVRLEQEMAVRKAQERLQDLEQEIQELKDTLAKESP